MSLQNLRDRVPDYAKDLKLNLGILAGEATLTDRQKAGTFIASALGARNAEVVAAVIAEFAPKLDAKELAAAQAAAAVMGMNNVYYRFLHLVGNEEYGKLPAKLRMNAIAMHGIARADFELWCLAVSAINACGSCVASHEKTVREAGLTAEQVQAAVRIAAVVNATAAVLDAETPVRHHAAALAA
ncbi:MAG: carboxymuconolactone decarboxylase family protein [Betaproteobacteria bacterium]|nr:carboxymuconolactone decarboxylase family protein [Betaproteobacteria bacterium]